MISNKEVLLPAGMLTRIINTKQQIIKNYETLLSFAYDDESKDMIEGIVFDEHSHLSIFINLYVDLFGTEPELLTNLTSPISSFALGLPFAVRSEFDTYAIYSNILLSDPNELVKSAFRRTTLDENIHSSKYLYLQTKLLNELIR